MSSACLPPGIGRVECISLTNRLHRQLRRLDIIDAEELKDMELVSGRSLNIAPPGYRSTTTLRAMF
jgi:hypothetical protein